MDASQLQPLLGREWLANIRHRGRNTQFMYSWRDMNYEGGFWVRWSLSILCLSHRCLWIVLRSFIQRSQYPHQLFSNCSLRGREILVWVVTGLRGCPCSLGFWNASLTSSLSNLAVRLVIFSIKTECKSIVQLESNGVFVSILERIYLSAGSTQMSAGI